MIIKFILFLRKCKKILFYFFGVLYFKLLSVVFDIEYGPRLRVFGLCKIFMIADTKLVIGENTTLNSLDSGYHASIYKGCKLMLDEPGAKIEIGSDTRVHGSCIHARQLVKIGDRCLIASNCLIMDSNGHSLSSKNPKERINTRGNSKPVIVQNDVWIGTGVVILPGTVIGEGSVISANCVVSGDVPAYSILSAKTNNVRGFEAYE